jgi:hypothetical protein
MDPHTLARWSGLVGGLCWLVRFVVDLAGSGTGGLADVLYWFGLVLLAVARAATGAGLVSRSAVWLRTIVAVAFPLLVWSVLEVLHPAGNPRAIDGVFGLVMVGVSAAGLRTARPAGRPRSRSAGAHSR